MEHKESCRTMSTGEFHGDPTKAWKDPTKNHECKTVERKNAFNTVTDLFTVIKI